MLAYENTIGRRPMARHVVAASLLAIALPAFAGPADAARKTDSFRVGKWSGGAYVHSVTGLHQRCGAFRSFHHGHTLLISRRSDGRWSFGISRPSWRLKKGRKVRLKYRINNKQIIDGQLWAAKPTMLAATFPADASIVRSFAGATSLDMKFAKFTVKFKLSDVRDVFSRLTKCHARNVGDTVTAGIEGGKAGGGTDLFSSFILGKGKAGNAPAPKVRDDDSALFSSFVGKKEAGNAPKPEAGDDDTALFSSFVGKRENRVDPAPGLKRQCRKAVGEKSVAACGQLIRTGKGKKLMVRAHYYRGVAQGTLGNDQAAFNDFSSALQFDANYTPVYVARGRMLAARGDKGRAIADFRRVLSLKPGHALAARELARLQAVQPPPVKEPPKVMALFSTGTNDQPPVAAPLIDKKAMGKRVALVIGNSRYASTTSLPNARRDADKVAETFRKLGFTKVTLVSDQSKAALERALIDFSDAATGADWAVIYYAGHGVEMNGQNYLVPVDANLKSDRHITLQTVNLQSMLTAAGGARKFRLVILDACRNNPFAASMKVTSSTRSIGRGLARVEPSGGTLVAYAARHGQVAFDGDGGNSPYVEALTRHITEPGLDVSLFFRKVRDSVLAATNNAQEPFVYGSLPGQVLSFQPVER